MTEPEVRAHFQEDSHGAGVEGTSFQQLKSGQKYKELSHQSQKFQKPGPRSKSKAPGWVRIFEIAVC